MKLVSGTKRNMNVKIPTDKKKKAVELLKGIISSDNVQSVTVLPAKEFDRVMEICDNPPEPTPLMKELIGLSLDDTFTITKRKTKR